MKQRTADVKDVVFLKITIKVQDGPDPTFSCFTSPLETFFNTQSDAPKSPLQIRHVESIVDYLLTLEDLKLTVNSAANNNILKIEI